MNKETLSEAIKSAPPLAAGGLTVFGYSLNEVVLLLTGLYTVFLIIDKIPTVWARVQSLVAWIKERTR